MGHLPEKGGVGKSVDYNTLAKELKDRITVLTIAYHNLAVEQEFMHMYQEALLSYQTARDFAHRYLSEDDKIYENLS